jgi:hypothetical protein
MDSVKIRAWWAHRQGLDGALSGKSAAEVLERAGWARSVGGSGPYLTLFSRAGLERERVDAAVAKLQIHELPSARGCTYVVSTADFGLALTVGREFDGEMGTAEKLGVTRKEIDKLCESVILALENEPLDPDGIKQAAGKAVRNLGPEGQKKGLTTTLPVALGILQASGEIRRVPVNGRLDQQRYKYALWRPNPLSHFKLSLEDAYAELARRFYRWIAPATLAEFQVFSGLGVKASKAAVEPLKLEPLAPGDDRLLMPEDRASFEAFKSPKDPCYALVSALDSTFLLHNDLKSVIDERDWRRDLLMTKQSSSGGMLKGLPSNAILDRGRVIGLWEYDSVMQSIAWTSFIDPDKALRKAVARTEDFVRNELGDVRSFSLDSPKSRTPRVEALRKAAAK